MRHRTLSGPLTWLLAVVAIALLAPSAGAAVLGQRLVLPNGLVVLVAEQRAVPIVAISLLVRTGSLCDPPAKPGLANLTAQLLSQGTTTRTGPQLSEAIDFIGGSLDVDAELETTAITMTLLSKDLDLGLELLGDLLIHPTFHPPDVERKIQEVIADLKRDQEDPATVSAQVFMHGLYGAQALGTPVEGTEASLPTITREDVVRFHATYYRPNQVILAVAGDVGVADLQQRLQARFGAWQPGGAPAIPAALAPAVPKRTVRVIPREVTQANITLGTVGIRRDNPDYYAVQVMNYLLGGGFSSYLIATIRDEKGWAYDVSSAFSTRKYGGEFTIALQTKNEVADQAIASAVAQMRRIRDTPVDAQALNDAKAYLTGSFPLGLDTTKKIAGRLAAIEYFGLGLDYVDRYPGLITAVTAADVQRVARKYLDPDTYVLAAVANLAVAKIKE